MQHEVTKNNHRDIRLDNFIFYKCAIKILIFSYFGVIIKYGVGAKEMFEATLSHGEANIKNHKLINFDNVKVKRINRTCHAITGSFVLGMDFDETVSVNINWIITVVQYN